MKKIVKMMAVLGLLSGLFGVVATRTPEVKAEAATTETKRVWATAKDLSFWFNDGAQFGIETKVGNTYVKSVMLQDINNNVVEGQSTWPIFYLDIPLNIESIQWFRKVGGNNYNFTGFVNYGTGLFYVKEFAQSSLSAGHIFSTTKVVSDFAATIDTSAEACVKANAEAAITAYNALSTFEQDQFDVLNVGGGKTGLERLNFLKSFYGISTPLNQNITQSNNDKNFLAISIIGVLSVSAIAGYYFLKTKKAI